jgi:hypothetical protein
MTWNQTFRPARYEREQIVDQDRRFKAAVHRAIREGLETPAIGTDRKPGTVRPQMLVVRSTDRPRQSLGDLPPPRNGIRIRRVATLDSHRYSDPITGDYVGEHLFRYAVSEPALRCLENP